jgi:hypothetical protein
MTFPYKEKSPPEDWEGWQKLERGDLAAEEVKVLMAEINEFNLESIFQSLVQELASSPEFTAICLGSVDISTKPNKSTGKVQKGHVASR